MDKKRLLTLVIFTFVVTSLYSQREINTLKLHERLIKSVQYKKFLKKDISPTYEHLYRSVNEEYSALDIAAMQNSVKTLQDLFSYLNENGYPYVFDQASPILNAIRYGSEDALRYLLESTSFNKEYYHELFQMKSKTYRNELLFNNLLTELQSKEQIDLQQNNFKSDIHYSVIDILFESWTPSIDVIIPDTIARNDHTSKIIGYLLEKQYITPNSLHDINFLFELTNRKSENLKLLTSTTNYMVQTADKYDKLVFYGNIINSFLSYGIDSLGILYRDQVFVKENLCEVLSTIKTNTITSKSRNYLGHLQKQNLFKNSKECIPFYIKLISETSEINASAIAEFVFSDSTHSILLKQSLLDKLAEKRYYSIISKALQPSIYPSEEGQAQLFNDNAWGILDNIYNQNGFILGVSKMKTKSPESVAYLAEKIFHRQLIDRYIPIAPDDQTKNLIDVNAKIRNTMVSRVSFHLYQPNGSPQTLYKNPANFNGIVDKKGLGLVANNFNEYVAIDLFGYLYEYYRDEMCAMYNNRRICLIKANSTENYTLHKSSFTFPSFPFNETVFPSVLVYSHCSENNDKVQVIRNGTPIKFKEIDTLDITHSNYNYIISETKPGFSYSFRFYLNNDLGSLDNLEKLNTSQLNKFENRFELYKSCYSFKETPHDLQSLYFKTAIVANHYYSNFTKDKDFESYALMEFEEAKHMVHLLDTLIKNYLNYLKSNTIIASIVTLIKDNENTLRSLSVYPNISKLETDKLFLRNYFEETIRKAQKNAISKYYILLYELNQLQVAEILSNEYEEIENINEIVNRL